MRKNLSCWPVVYTAKLGPRVAVSSAKSSRVRRALTPNYKVYEKLATIKFFALYNIISRKESIIIFKCIFLKLQSVMIIC